MYYQWLFLLPGYTRLNSGLFHNHQQLDNDESNAFKHSELHFLDLNINNLFPKIDELRHIAKLTNAAVIEISELMIPCPHQKFELLGIQIISIKIQKTYFFELWLLNSKAIVVGTICHPHNWTYFRRLFMKTI